MRPRRLALASAAALVVPALVAAGGAAPSAGAAPGALEPADGVHRATITRTEHGIPHVVADDWESLGFGHGYATAETSICNLADTILTGRGERSRWFGADARYRDRVTLDATNLQADTFFGDVRNRKVVEELLADPVRGPGQQARAMVAGYAAGANAYLRDVGGAKGIKDPACRGAGWVREASALDLWYGVYAANMLASAGVFVPQIADASPPSLKQLGLPLDGLLDGLPLQDVPLPDLSDALPFAKAPARTPSAEQLRSALGKDPDAGFGSNATAVGSELSSDGRSRLLGNPHFPWEERYRFTQSHLTIPGVYDVAGASLMGSPVVNIGFNEDVAWSHTVSTAYRFTPYEYRTLPGLPTTYLTDKGLRRLEKRAVKVTVKQPSGLLGTVTKHVHRTDEGYVIDAPDMLMGWTPISVFAIRDANAEHLRTIDTFLEMGKASDVRGLLAAQDAGGGMPWVNTVAADRGGEVLYADHSVVPNVPDDLVGRCITPIGLLTRQLAGLPVLDGTRAGSSCAWRDDADAQRPGIFGPANLPATFRRDWVANANDSYWLPNPDEPLEGYAAIIGCERCDRTLRTQMVYRYVFEAATAAGITHERMRGFQHENRVLAAERAKVGGDLDTVCRKAGGEAECDVLARWDATNDASSRGAILFQEFWSRVGSAPWAVPFDVEDPMNTPRDLKQGDAAVVTAMRDAIAVLRERGVAADAPLGSQQVADKPGAPIALGGGDAASGNANALAWRPPHRRTQELYRVNYGSSHIQAVSFTDSSVQASTILTYGQSLDTTSPWSRDQTELFGQERWVEFPFTSDQVAAQRISSKTVTARR